jgi:hypothetical protein
VGDQLDGFIVIIWAKMLQCLINSKMGGHRITSGNCEERNFLKYVELYFGSSVLLRFAVIYLYVIISYYVKINN